MTRIAYLDCFAGVSGDMLLGALLDIGWDLAELQAVVDALKLGEISIEASPVKKHNLMGTQVTIHAPETQSLRRPAELTALLDKADIDESIRSRAKEIILKLARVEARVHGVNLEAVHFHELGAIDTIVDVVGVVSGLEALSVKQIVCSPLPWSHGTLKTEHGAIPLPGPAVTALLEGVPVTGVDIHGETVTPTGAALVTVLTNKFGPMPDMTLSKIGYGAGSHDWPHLPNLLRLVIGESAKSNTLATSETLVVLSSNIDDMNPEWYGPLAEAMFSANALDIWLTPTYMKKWRPAIMVEVLCKPEDAAGLRALLFRETTTLGVREQQISRWALLRKIRTVETPYGSIRVKVAYMNDAEHKFSPEHDDCVVAASKHNVSTREVWLAAIEAAQLLNVTD